MDLGNAHLAGTEDDTMDGMRKWNVGQVAHLGGAWQIRKAEEYAASIAPALEEMLRAGIKSWRQLAEGLNARGLTTRTGHRWRHCTVAEMLRRLPDLHYFHEERRGKVGRVRL